MCAKHCCRILWGLLALAGLVLAGALQPWRLVYNYTTSMPLGVYAVKLEKGARYRPGDTVAYRYVAPDWALERYQRYIPDGSRFLKVVGAAPGDYLHSQELRVYRCAGPQFDASCRLLGVRLAKDRQGRPLPGKTYAGERVPEGYYWLTSGSSTEPNAFDSRYLGLIPASRIEGRVYPVLTW